MNTRPPRRLAPDQGSTKSSITDPNAVLEKVIEERTEGLRRTIGELERINAELAAFNYVASHDLQEPLRKIQSFTTRIIEKDGKSISPVSQEYIRRMQNATKRMQRLITDLLAYSQLNTRDHGLQLTDLNILLDDVKSELREVIEEKKGIIACGLLPELRVIPFQFSQLFTNLLSNSIKFSREDAPPQITITAEKVQGNEIPVHPANPERTYFKFMVVDNGIGFNQKYSEQIFKVFQRLHGKAEYGGVGIGLAICKRIVENHEGFISASAEENKGATFTFYVPVL